MYFSLVDTVLEQTADRIVTLKQVTNAEEYLLDHFPGFPILPGVMMLEAMVQAARILLRARDPMFGRHVLGEVRALKYGAMVKPGASIRVDVAHHMAENEDVHVFKGLVRLVRVNQLASELPDDAPTAASGRFTLRPIAFVGSAEHMAVYGAPGR